MQTCHDPRPVAFILDLRRICADQVSMLDQDSAVGSALQVGCKTGGGCTLGDIIAEWSVFFVPFTLFGRQIFGTWVLDFIMAFLLGIAFQYFTLKPMRELSVGAALGAAIKADTLSLIAWQIGMYG